MVPQSGLPRIILIALVFVVGFATLFLMYNYASPSITCHPLPSSAIKIQKPIMLLWFKPPNLDLTDCKTLFNIDGCHLTDDRALYNAADAVLISHADIKTDLSNLPPSPRFPSQKWIWFHLDSPTNTQKVPGIEGLFNETLNYRNDADIPVRWQLTVKEEGETFVLPKKERLVCWIMSKNDTTNVGYNYYIELSKHMKVDVFNFGSTVSDEEYFSTIASCKFFLALENSIHKDYITDLLTEPLAVGTVPVVLGPSRTNYEEFVQGDAFIHVNDFPEPKALAEALTKLDKDDDAYMRYFGWHEHFSARAHPIAQRQEVIRAICAGCEYTGRQREFRLIHDVYKWYFNEKAN